MASLTFTPIQKSALSSATASDSTYLSTSTNNTNVYNMISSIITQLQGNTTYLNANTSATLIKLYTSLKSLAQSLSVSSYTGSDTDSVPIIKQYYDTVYAKYNAGGFTTQTTYLSTYDPSRTNMLYTLWKLISNAVLAVSTVVGTTATVQFNTTYMTNARVTTLLQSVQQIIYIHNILLSDMAAIHAYVNSDSVMIDTDITILNTDPYLNNSFPVIESVYITTPTTLILIGSDILSNLSIYPLTNGLTYSYNADVIYPASMVAGATLNLSYSPKVGTNKITLSSLSTLSSGYYYACIGGTYDGTPYGGSSVTIHEYNYITAIDTTTNTLTLDIPINKNHFLGTNIKIAIDQYTYPGNGFITKGYSMMKYQAPQNRASLYVDYIPNISVGDFYSTNNTEVVSTFQVGTLNTPPNNTLLYFNEAENKATSISNINTLVIFYSPKDPLPNGVTLLLNARLSGTTSSGSTTVNLKSRNNNTVGNQDIYYSTTVPVNSFFTIGGGDTQLSGWFKAVSTWGLNSVNMPTVVQSSFPENSIVRVYQGYTTDTAATPIGQTTGNPIPQLATGTATTTCKQNVNIGDTVIKVLSTKSIKKNYFMSFDVGDNNEYNLTVSSVDYVNNTITVYPAFRKAHVINSCAFFYTFQYTWASFIPPPDSTLLGLTTVYQPNATSTTFTSTNTTPIIVNPINYPIPINGYLVATLDSGPTMYYRTVTSYDIATGSLYTIGNDGGGTFKTKNPFMFFTYPVLPPTESFGMVAYLKSPVTAGSNTLIQDKSTGFLTGPIAAKVRALVDPAGNCEDMYITSYTSATYTCTFSSNFIYNHAAGCTILFYKIPDFPTNSTPIGITSTLYDSYAGDPVIYVKSTVGMVEGQTYILVYGNSREDTDFLVTKINGNQITLNKNLAYTHYSNSSVQIYSKTPAPSDIFSGYTYPYNIITPGSTTISTTAYTANSNTVVVFSNTGIVAGYTYVQMEQGRNSEKSLVTTFTSKTLTLATPFTKSYPIGQRVLTYMYTPVPLGTTLLNQSLLTDTTTVGTTTINVSSSSNVTPYTTGVMIAGGCLVTPLENRVIKSISGNTLTLDYPLLYTHNINEIVQFYSIPNIPSYGTHTGSAQLLITGNSGYNKINVSSVLNVVAGSTYLQLDSGSNLEQNVLVKSIDQTTNTLTISTLKVLHKALVVIKYYTIPSIPLNTTAVGMSNITSSSLVGDTVLQITGFTELYTGTLYAQIGTGNTAETNIAVTFISSTSITLSSSLSFAHSSGEPIQFYTYPSLPSGAASNGIAILSADYLSGTTLTVNNSNGILAGMYLQLGSDSTLQRGILVSSVIGNTVTISAPLTYTYISGSVVQIYSYSSTPADTTAILSTISTAMATASTKVITVSSTTGIVPKKTYMQIDYGSSLESNFLVKSVTDTTVTLYASLTKDHLSGVSVQFYKFQDPPLDGTSVLVTTVAADYSSGTSLTVASAAGIVAGKTLFLVGASSAVEQNNLVTSVSGNTITFSSPLIHTYLIGRRVVFYAYPDIPSNSTKISTYSLSTASSISGNQITLSSVDGLVVDSSYLQIGSGSSLETNLLVTGISQNVVTLNTSLSYNHPSNTVVQSYKYHDLPSDTILVGLYKSTVSIQSGFSYVQFSSISGLVAGSTYIQISSDNTVEADLLITSINSQLKTITVSPAFSYTHSSNIYVQAYTAVPLPIGSTKVGMVKLTSEVSAGNTTATVTNVSGVTAGMRVTIGSKDIYERDLLITAVDASTKTITISTPFAYPHGSAMPLQFYTYPVLPTNAVFGGLVTISSQINAQSSTVLVSSTAGLNVGQRLYIGYGSTIETRIISSILSNEPRIIFNSPTNYIHAAGEPIQLFSYTPPSIPTGSNAVSNGSTFLSDAANVGSTTVSVVSSANISIGDCIILDVDSWVETKIVIGITGTTLTLNTPISINHQRYSSVIQYYVPPPSLPSTSTALPTTLVEATSTAGTNTLQVLNASNISVGTFILVNVASAAETKLVLGVTGNVLTLDSNFSNSHESYTLVQIYTFPVPDLPDYANTATKTSKRILGVADYCDNYIQLPSVSGITAGTYYLLDVDGNTEVSLIVGVDTVNNKIFPELPLNKSHRNGSLIQFFDAVQPKGSILVNHGTIYGYVTTGKTQNNGLLNGVGTDEALSVQLAQLLTSLEGSTDDLKKDTVSLLTPIKAVVDSYCLTANMSYPSLSAFIPYYFMIGSNYGSQLPKLSSFDLRPYVYAIWEILYGIVNTIVPGIISGTVTTLSTLTSQVAIMFNLYDNLFLLREDLDVYVESCGILYYHGHPYLGINGFVGIPTVLYGGGVMIGAGINSLNEAGTIYPSNKPVLKPTQQVTAVTSSTVPVKAGTNKIQVPPSTGVIIGQQVIIDIGLAQEICTVIGFGSLILSPPLSKPHPAGTVVMAVDNLHNINFVIEDFNTSIRLSQEVYTEKEIVESPTSTFTAYGDIPLDTFRNCFMFGTTDVAAYSLGKLQDPLYSQDVTYYVDSSNWQTTKENPIIRISDFRCAPNRLNPSDFTSIQNPELAILLSAFLCLKAFKIKDSQVLVKNHKQYADSISDTFINDVWNNLFYGLLWSQDFNRKPGDTLVIKDSFGIDHTYTTSPELVEDPLFSSLMCGIDKEVPVVLGNKLMHQLAAIDLERLKSDYLTLVAGTDFMYYIPLRADDKIIFKLKTAYATNNIYRLFNVTEETAPLEIKQLNDSFNAAIVEDEDYVSFTIVLNLV